MTKVYGSEITFDAFVKLLELDKTLIGTKDYMGVAYFWGLNGCKYILRDATAAQRKKIHHRWIKEGLDFLKETDQHHQIIFEVTGIR